MRTTAAGIALIVLLAVPSAAQARSSYCSPSGDYCTSVKERGSGAVLRLGTFSFRGRVRVCVRAPRGGGTCKRFRLRRTSNGIYEIRRRWGAHFPDRGPGVYRVRFQKFGDTLGPVLSFRR